MSEYLDRVRNIRENPEQSQALDATDSCVVIAGPGSGKTYLLATKVARLLYEGLPAPRGVACLTFSNLLMEQLKADLRQLGVLSTSRLFVGTVHSFCLNEIIHRYGHLYNEVRLPEPFRIASEQECIQAVREALLDQGIDCAGCVNLAKRGYRWIDLVHYLSKYRRLHPYYDNSWFRDNRWANLRWSTVLSRIDWAHLARGYVDTLLHNDPASVDFTEIEVIALRMVEQHQLVREVLAARYPWFAIDEYQDLGYPFHRMMTTLLTESEIRVFAIGDPDQCIYEELQGTSPRYMLELAEQIQAEQGFSPIELAHNYRCAPNLIEVSERVLGERKGYRSSRAGGTCLCYPCRDLEEQQQLIFEDILPSLLRGSEGPQFSLGEIAILHPWRGQLEGQGVNRLSQALDDLENAWAFTLDKDITYDSRRSKVIEWLELAAQWCLDGWKTGKPYFRDMLPFWTRLNTDPQSQLPAEGRFKLEQELFSVLWRLRCCRANEEISFADWVNGIRKGLNLDCLLTAYGIAAPDDVSEFRRIADDLKGGSRLSRWPLSRFARGPGRMQLTTLHSSKGTQFGAVIIAGLDKVGWSSVGVSEQDRRLAYVAVTRAKQRLYLLFEGMPEILENLREDPPEGCYFCERREISNGSAVWQRPLF